MILPSLPGSDPAALAKIGEAVRERLDANAGAYRTDCAGLELYSVPNFLSPAECAALIEMIDSDAKPSVSLRPDDGPNPRTSETCDLAAGEPLVARIERRICDLLGQPPSHSETVQGQRYSPGQFFGVHSDFFAAGQPHSDAVAAEGGQRTWTAMAYLNWPEKGGQTHFPFVPLLVPPTPGLLLIWNNLDREGRSNPFSRHQGLAVEAGVKHVLTKWFREREWHSSAASNALRH